MLEKKRSGWVGIALTVAMVIAGIYYVNYQKQRKTNEYIVYYTNIKGLQPSSPVVMKGVRIGKIKTIELQDNKLLKVVMLISKNVVLHDSTKAMLASGGLVSERSIDIIDTIGKSILPNGSILVSDLDTTAQTTSLQITPYLVTAKYILHSADSTLLSIRYMTTTGIVSQFIIPLTEFEKNIRGYATSSADWNNKTTELSNTVNKVNTTLNEVAKNSNGWNTQLKNIDNSTYKTSKSSIRSNIDSLNQNLKSISEAAKGIDNLTGNKSSYNNTTKAATEINNDMKELQKSPPGFSIFGKSKKKK